MSDIQKNQRINQRLNKQIEKYREQYVNYINHGHELLDKIDLEYGIFKNCPKDHKELAKQLETIEFKYCLVPDLSNFSYFAWLFEFIKIRPLEKCKFWIKNPLTEKSYRPNIYEFLNTFNTGTYLVAYGLDREAHDCRYDIVHNGKILDNFHNTIFDKMIQETDISKKQDSLKNLRKQFNSKVVDVVKINETNPKLEFLN